MDAITESNDNMDATDDANDNMLLLQGFMGIYQHKMLMFSVAFTDSVTRNGAFFDERMDFYRFMNKFSGHREPLFRRHMRMSKESYMKLLEILRPVLEKNVLQANRRGGPIVPEVQLYAAIRWLAGGSYVDIHERSGISIGAFYYTVRDVYKAIADCDHPLLDNIKFPKTVAECAAAANGFKGISSFEAIRNCVTVIDGWFMRTRTPPKSEVDNVHSYYSGHYAAYGVNIQFGTDHLCRFTYHGIAGPGSCGDINAYNNCALSDMIGQLPAPFVAIGDSAYNPIEQLVTIFYGNDRLLKKNDDWNYFASQLRIRSVNKWGIFSRPLMCGQKNQKWIVLGGCMLAQLLHQRKACRLAR